MLTRLSLRMRIFLFFCLLAVSGVAINAIALLIGYRRAGSTGIPDAFIFAGLLSGFAMVALTTAVWLLFDENIAKPIQRLAAQMRVRADAGVRDDIELDGARYLGDLAPAAHAVAGRLGDTALQTAAAVASETARLSADQERLTRLLTEIPVAIVLVNPAHRIVLYDDQAAQVLAQVAPVRLHASLFDYIAPDALRRGYRELERTGKETRCTILGADGVQSHEVRLKPLGDAPGYLLIFETSEIRIAPDAPRPLVYDFDLLDPRENASFLDRDLSELCFVVFDTETTGLLPHKDKVVQIGAVRVVRGRIIPGESLDLLVNPEIPIPPASSRVHGITDQMVSGAPCIDQAGRVLHDFCRDAVIVAHNAPFDMAFLHRHDGQMGVCWDHPILDTVLLSAVLFGITETHSLDSLCERLGVTIPEPLRHTALGDARATAEALCLMLPMLKARGMNTLGDVIGETRKHGRLLKDLN
ncbi:3'-5' exonuclease [Rhodobacteraceae bacterium F11138]|nr:3'-5' exonuclease [Rhodobacteraceae bacterium F11138]